MCPDSTKANKAQYKYFRFKFFFWFLQSNILISNGQKERYKLSINLSKQCNGECCYGAIFTTSNKLQHVSRS